MIYCLGCLRSHCGFQMSWQVLQGTLREVFVHFGDQQCLRLLPKRLAQITQHMRWGSHHQTIVGLVGGLLLDETGDILRETCRGQSPRIL